MAKVTRLILLRETEKAIQVKERNGEPAWIPKSQITYRKNYSVPAGHKECDIEIPDWLCDDKQLSGV
jgi:hypothetical protein